MDRREFIVVMSAAVGLAVIAACGGGESGEESKSEGQTPVSPIAEPVLFEVRVGARGGLGTGGAFITQEAWEPKRLDVPVGQPFKIRFIPTDERFHPIVSLALGLDLEVKDGRPAESPALTVNEPNKLIDIFCREHRGAGGFGTIIGIKP
jgi:plastocyanin